MRRGKKHQQETVATRACMFTRPGMSCVFVEKCQATVRSRLAGPSEKRERCNRGELKRKNREGKKRKVISKDCRKRKIKQGRGKEEEKKKKRKEERKTFLRLKQKASSLYLEERWSISWRVLEAVSPLLQ